MEVGAENVIEQLKSTVASIIRKTGVDNEYAQGLMTRIHALQDKVDTLRDTDKIEFLNMMKTSFRSTVDNVEKKLMQYAQFQKVYNYSIVAAVVLTIMLVVALFGYKLYKSLMEKELKKQEKIKTKQAKKSKKTN